MSTGLQTANPPNFSNVRQTVQESLRESQGALKALLTATRADKDDVARIIKRLIKVNVSDQITEYQVSFKDAQKKYYSSLDSMEEEVRSQKTEQALICGRMTEQMRSINSAEKDADQLLKKSKVIKSDMKNAQNQLKENEARVQAVSSQKKSRQDCRDKLSQQLQDQTSELQKLFQKRNDANRDKVNSEAALNNERAKAYQLQKDIQAADGQKKDEEIKLERKRKELQDERVELEARKIRLRKENEAVKKTAILAASLAIGGALFTGGLSLLASGAAGGVAYALLNQLSKEYEEQINFVLELEQAIRLMLNILKEIELRIASLNHQMWEQAKNGDACERDYKAKQATAAKADKEYDEANSQIQDSQDKVRKLKEELKELDLYLDKSKKEQDDLQEKITCLKGEVNRQKSELIKIGSKTQSLHKQSDLHKKKLKALEAIKTDPGDAEILSKLQEQCEQVSRASDAVSKMCEMIKSKFEGINFIGKLIIKEIEEFGLTSGIITKVQGFLENIEKALTSMSSEADQHISFTQLFMQYDQRSQILRP